jgi:hypothetical protein
MKFVECLAQLHININYSTEKLIATSQSAYFSGNLNVIYMACWKFLGGQFSLPPFTPWQVPSAEQP